jgi:hypothetical protein
MRAATIAGVCLSVVGMSGVWAADASPAAVSTAPVAAPAVTTAPADATTSITPAAATPVIPAPATPAASAPVTPAPATPATPTAAATPATPGLPPVAQAIWVKGAVTAAQPSQAPRSLERRSVLFEHDVVATSKTSSGEIGFTDGSVVSLNPDSQFQIDQYSFKVGGGGGAQDKTVMKLLKGGFRTITGAIPKENPDGYKVNTPVATIGVRGTQYVSVLSPEKGLVLSIEKGTIKITNGAGQMDLSTCTGAACKPYSIVKAFDLPPVVTAQRPTEVINVSPVTPIPHGWGGPGEAGAPGTPPVPAANSYAPVQMRPAGFCVGFLEELYQRLPHYIG